MGHYKVLSDSTRIVLIDNGSLRAESALNLRRLAAALSDRIGAKTHPVSLLHSSKIDPAQLNGQPADTWRRFLRRERAAGACRFLVIPLFFGPSSAISDYLPKVARDVLGPATDWELAIAGSLVNPDDPSDNAVARLMTDLLIEKLNTERFAEPPVVVLVDHGSPLQSVANCRNLVAEQMAKLLGERVVSVVASSMERREGAEFDFNEPLLETALSELHRSGRTEAILSPMFLSPGRHAGPGGDIAAIVAQSEWTLAGKRLPSAPLAGESPQLVPLLEHRFRQLGGHGR